MACTYFVRFDVIDYTSTYGARRSVVSSCWQGMDGVVFLEIPPQYFKLRFVLFVVAYNPALLNNRAPK